MTWRQNYWSGAVVKIFPSYLRIHCARLISMKVNAAFSSLCKWSLTPVNDVVSVKANTVVRYFWASLSAWGTTKSSAFWLVFKKIYCSAVRKAPRAFKNVPCSVGQARLNGAFCDYGEKQKMSYLEEVHKAGVRNIEMESLCFAAMCRRAGIAAAVVCVSLVNRLNGDQLHLTPQEHEEYQLRPMKLIIFYIIERLLNKRQ